MKITNKNKRGFTLVELIVVIAIVAILAAVSVVSYMAFINQANVSNDTQIVKELNTILQGDEALHGPRDTYHEVLEVVGENGFLVEKLTPRTNGYRIVYDKPHNRFALLNEKDDPVYQDTGSRQYKYVLGQVWNIVNKGETLSDKFANYLGESYDFTGNTVFQITTGLDVGNHTERREIKYVGQLGAEHPISGTQHAIVRTMGGTFTVENSNDDVTHYGLSTEVSVKDVKKGTYKEFGTVGRLYYEDAEGSIQLLKKEDNAIFCYMNKTTDTLANKASAAAENATVYTWVDANADAASGYGVDISAGVTEVTVTDSEVNVGECHNHNAAGNYELIRIGDLQYIICKACGGFALYEGENQSPIEKSSEIDTGGDPFNYNPVNLNDEFGFYNSYEQDGHWVHEITTKAHFKNIMKHISLYKNNTDYVNLANKETVYLLKNDINFGGNLWNGESYVLNEVFKGHLIGETQNNGKIKLSNISTSTTYTAGNGEKCMFCLFCMTYDSEFKNIELSNIRLSKSDGKRCGLFAYGNEVAVGSVNSIKFNNCEIDDTCSVNVSANAGAYIGCTRGVTEVVFENCINSADVICGSTNIGAFVGSGSTLGTVDEITAFNTIKFTNCVNNGEIMGSNYVGGFTGNSGAANRKILGTGNVNNGNVYVSDTGTKQSYGMFVSGDAGQDVWYRNDSNFSGKMTGKIYAKITSGGYEFSHLASFPYNLTNSENQVINSSNYLEYVNLNTNVSLDPYFDGNEKLKFTNSVDCDRVVVNIRQHGLNINKTLYWDSENEAGTPIFNPDQSIYQTNENGGSMQAETHAYIASLTFNTLNDVDVTKVTQCGWFLPENANAPHVSYAAFDTYQIESSLYGEEGYEGGYHVSSGGVGYLVVDNNDVSSPTYLGICDWRNEIIYEITAYNGKQIVGSGDVSWGRGSGDATSLTTISL